MKRPGYLNRLEGVVAHREDPIGAAIRADQTAYRHVVDRQHDYQGALARGDANEIASTRAALRQAWETDVRRHGWKPEDHIPNYPNPPQHGFFGEGKKAMAVTKLLGLAMAAYFVWIVFGTLSSPVTEGIVVIA